MRSITFAVPLLIGLLAGTVSPIAFAACSAASAADHPHLVELYTTTGCSSCPPAEKWMSSLKGKADLVGLAFHVDYWDTSDWRDPFDSHDYTKRQIALADRTKSKQYYTPQIWFDGRLWRDWPKGAPPTPYAGPSPALKLEVSNDGAALHAAIEVANGTQNADALRAYVAVSENGLSQYVKGGENKGKTLPQNQVVRALAGPLPLPKASTDLKLPAGIDLSRSNVVAFLQNTRNGDVVQVVRLPLKQCGFVQAEQAGRNDGTAE